MVKWVRSVTTNRVKVYDAASSFEDIGKPFFERNKQVLALQEFGRDLKKRITKNKSV